MSSRNWKRSKPESTTTLDPSVFSVPWGVHPNQPISSSSSSSSTSSSSSHSSSWRPTQPSLSLSSSSFSSSSSSSSLINSMHLPPEIRHIWSSIPSNEEKNMILYASQCARNKGTMICGKPSMKPNSNASAICIEFRNNAVLVDGTYHCRSCGSAHEREYDGSQYNFDPDHAAALVTSSSHPGSLFKSNSVLSSKKEEGKKKKKQTLPVKNRSDRLIQSSEEQYDICLNEDGQEEEAEEESNNSKTTFSDSSATSTEKTSKRETENKKKQDMKQKKELEKKKKKQDKEEIARQKAQDKEKKKQESREEKKKMREEKKKQKQVEKEEKREEKKSKSKPSQTRKDSQQKEEEKQDEETENEKEEKTETMDKSTLLSMKRKRSPGREEEEPKKKRKKSKKKPRPNILVQTELFDIYKDNIIQILRDKLGDDEPDDKISQLANDIIATSADTWQKLRQYARMVSQSIGVLHHKVVIFISFLHHSIPIVESDFVIRMGTDADTWYSSWMYIMRKFKKSNGEEDDTLVLMPSIPNADLSLAFTHYIMRTASSSLIFDEKEQIYISNLEMGINNLLEQLNVNSKYFIHGPRAEKKRKVKTRAQNCTLFVRPWVLPVVVMFNAFFSTAMIKESVVPAVQQPVKENTTKKMEINQQVTDKSYLSDGEEDGIADDDTKEEKEPENEEEEEEEEEKKTIEKKEKIYQRKDSMVPKKVQFVLTDEQKTSQQKLYDFIKPMFSTVQINIINTERVYMRSCWRYMDEQLIRLVYAIYGTR